MNNEKLFNILEYLIDHCEHFLKRSGDDLEYDYCKEIRKEVFSNTSGNPLTFNIDEKDIMKKALEDFRDFGTRHDINPTGMFKTAQDGTTFFDSMIEDSWQGYIRSQDRSVRDRAKIALEKIK